ncbi:maleylpyruvate isomerase N-terminal domain-containing protein [Iamia sp.]|uniref:maleylpyruvate isomerase N-terminal domain-containing protein n=1 Tax=Iamia sp. TaxID=2722710 RepID=UPI0039C8A411
MDLFALLAAERRRLADELEGLTAAEWEQASLCAGWTNHTVVAHLTLPWSISSPQFLLGLVRGAREHRSGHGPVLPGAGRARRAPRVCGLVARARRGSLHTTRLRARGAAHRRRGPRRRHPPAPRPRRHP